MNEEQLNEFKELFENGQIALDNKRYEEAWDNLYSAYKMKKDFFKSKRVSIKNIDDEDYAKTCYFLAQIMKEIKATNSLIDKVKKEDEDLLKNHYSGAKARKFLGRKYLKLAADKDYPAAIVEYALNCIGYAPHGKLDFEYNKENLETALYWANNVMKKHRNKYVSAMGFCIHAIYCLDEYKETKDSTHLLEFAKNILEAQKINDYNFEQYITYYLGYLYSFPKMEEYNDGEYYDANKGYKAFSDVINLGSDDYLIRNAKKLKEGIEKAYPEVM